MKGPKVKTIARSVIGLMALLGAGVAGDARAQVCTNTPLPEVSTAVIPANGFPLYYDDANGLALTPCLDPAAAGFCGGVAGVPVPNPAAAVAFPGNFPAEFPYFSAVATMTLPNGGKALLLHRVLGSFFPPAAPVPAAGAQLVFSRLRIRIPGLQPGGTYTITHPYGVETLVANNLGAINVTFDSGIAAPGFTGPVTAGSRVGPSFLQWDAALPPPPAGFIGDGLTLHTITGSPCGTNVFKVEGPFLPAGGVQTPLFVVTGKKIDVCGNGVLDIGEQCDDGNKLAGDCCSPTCKFEPLGSLCTDGNPCTTDACNGAGVCLPTPNMALCNDGNACTTPDVCTAGTCVGGPALNCNDGNPCTTDTCAPATGCVHTPIQGCVICTPTTCAAQGKNCGTIPNGCGGTLTCGVCTAPQTCGGAGVANVCAVPLPAATLTLTASGRAGETIASTPAGLSVRVGTTGSASFAGGTRITLRDTNGRSVIWSGVCSSAGNKTPTCTFTLIANASETANVQ